MGSSDTMQAVIFKAPWTMATEKRPIPKIIEPTDALVKVSVAGICGSDLHFYRGHQKMEPDCICVSVPVLCLPLIHTSFLHRVLVDSETMNAIIQHAGNAHIDLVGDISIPLKGRWGARHDPIPEQHSIQT
jgi:hypothetical protein